MRKMSLFITASLLIMFVSCKKDYSCTCVSIGRHPVTNANLGGTQISTINDTNGTLCGSVTKLERIIIMQLQYTRVVSWSDLTVSVNYVNLLEVQTVDIFYITRLELTIWLCSISSAYAIFHTRSIALKCFFFKVDTAPYFFYLH